ncbi:MAG: enterochelin esterase [Alphaproteobacteria bacterium]|nr:enterochelin esterase [Alphaproteobacteria bacterium]
MRRNPDNPAGRVESFTLDSAILKDNLLGDPSRRRIDVYLPLGHGGEGLPLLVDLVGFTAGGPVHTNWKNFGENVPERLDRLIATGLMPPVAVAFPDCFTRLGGNQYINSAAMGHYDDFVRLEVVAEVERRFGCGGEGKRGVFGKSSGGYGAIVHALLHPDFWSAAACHSGDMGFELCYLRDMPRVLRAVAKAGGIEKWFERFLANPKPSDDDIHVLMDFAMAATYDPDPAAPYGVRLPVDPHTCELIAERWARWMEWDPLVLAEHRAEGLKRLKMLYVDCGDVDQFDLVYGARRLHRLLQTKGVPHVYEEFSDNHSSVDYRMDVSLPLLAKALS